MKYILLFFLSLPLSSQHFVVFECTNNSCAVYSKLNIQNIRLNEKDYKGYEFNKNNKLYKINLGNVEDELIKSPVSVKLKNDYVIFFSKDSVELKSNLQESEITKLLTDNERGASTAYQNFADHMKKYNEQKDNLDDFDKTALLLIADALKYSQKYKNIAELLYQRAVIYSYCYKDDKKILNYTNEALLFNQKQMNKSNLLYQKTFSLSHLNRHKEAYDCGKVALDFPQKNSKNSAWLLIDKAYQSIRLKSSYKEVILNIEAALNFIAKNDYTKKEIDQAHLLFLKTYLLIKINKYNKNDKKTIESIENTIKHIEKTSFYRKKDFNLSYLYYHKTMIKSYLVGSGCDEEIISDMSDCIEKVKKFKNELAYKHMLLNLLYSKIVRQNYLLNKNHKKIDDYLYDINEALDLMDSMGKEIKCQVKLKLLYYKIYTKLFYKKTYNESVLKDIEEAFCLLEKLRLDKGTLILTDLLYNKSFLMSQLYKHSGDNKMHGIIIKNIENTIDLINITNHKKNCLPWLYSHLKLRNWYLAPSSSYEVSTDDLKDLEVDNFNLDYEISSNEFFEIEFEENLCDSDDKSIFKDLVYYTDVPNKPNQNAQLELKNEINREETHLISENLLSSNNTPHQESKRKKHINNKWLPISERLELPLEEDKRASLPSYKDVFGVESYQDDEDYEEEDDDDDESLNFNHKKHKKN